MQNKLHIAILVAISFGSIAAYGIYNFLRQQRLAMEGFKHSTQDVVVAAKEIPAGTALTPDMVKVSSYLKTSVPPGFFSAPDQVTGKVARTPVVAGEPLLASRMGERAGLTVLLTPGHRAMAVKVNEIIGVSGFIAPDDRVDVIANVEQPGTTGREGQISKIVLQNRRVLSVAQTMEQTKDGKPQVASSITLELTPEDAEKLSLASQEGKILLALRSTQDERIVQTQGSTTRDLLALAAPQKRNGVVGPRPAYTVEVYRGTEKTVHHF